MTYSLIRDEDGTGQSGPILEVLRRKPEGGLEFKTECPQVGWAVRVSDIRGNWWCTTLVTEIISDTDDGEVRTIRFKTGNSVYTFKEH